MESAPRRKRRRGPIIALVIVGILVFGIAGAGFAFTNYLDGCREPSGAQQPVEFTIPDGATGGEVVDDLVSAGVLECPRVVRWDLKKRGLESSFEAGDYHLMTNMSLDEA